jgi:membrane protease YdiL (CAAX protease family)
MARHVTGSDHRRTTRNLAIFIVTALGIGWLGRLLDVATGQPSTEGPGILLWIVTPATVAVLLRTFAGDGWADAGLTPNLRGNGRWYVLALLVYPVLATIVVAVGALLGLITIAGLSWAALAAILQTSALALAPQVLKNIFEESAWRGYLAPKIYGLGWNDYLGHVVVGLVWGAWHIPYYLHFLDRTVLQQFTTLPLAVFIVAAIVVMVVWAIVYGELLLLTRSIWPAVLMHSVEDAFVNPLFTERRIAIERGADWLVSPVNGLVSIALFLALGVGLNRYRRARKR